MAEPGMTAEELAAELEDDMRSCPDCEELRDGEFNMCPEHSARFQGDDEP